MNTISSSASRFYSHHGPVTDPGRLAHLLRDLPSDLAGLCRIVQGTMVPIFWAQRLGLELSEQRKQEVSLRAIAKMLARMEELAPDLPLTETRPLDRRLVGNCRDFSVMLCAMLRHQGVPARARCGFGTHFRPGAYEDHWPGGCAAGARPTRTSSESSICTASGSSRAT
ncbi:MAG: transglutaminase domain-containing protein [Bacillota bacterium]|nr:transglutaminase domain-containing protein [Bacillota bacterium]